MSKSNSHPPAFQFYANDFSSSSVVEAMSTQAVGAYILLLCKAWHQEPVGTLPENEDTLCKWARVTKGEWKKIRADVIAAFELKDGRYVQKRMQDEWQSLVKRSQDRSEAGSRGNAKRWDGDRSDIAGRQSCDQFASRKGVANDRSSSSSSPSSSERKEESLSLGDKKTFLTGVPQLVSRFWDVYPKRVKEGEIEDAIQVAIAVVSERKEIDDDAAFDFILSSAIEYANSPAGKPASAGNDRRPAPGLWLTARRFFDDRKEWLVPNGDSPKAAAAAKKRKVEQIPDAPVIAPKAADDPIDLGAALEEIVFSAVPKPPPPPPTPTMSREAQIELLNRMDASGVMS